MLSWLLGEKSLPAIKCFCLEVIYVTSAQILSVKASHVTVSKFKGVQFYYMPERRKTRLFINSFITLWNKWNYILKTKCLFENTLCSINDYILFSCIFKWKKLNTVKIVSYEVEFFNMLNHVVNSDFITILQCCSSRTLWGCLRLSKSTKQLPFLKVRYPF